MESWLKVRFKEDAQGEQMIVHKIDSSPPLNTFYYVDAKLRISVLLECSDACLKALNNLINDRGRVSRPYHSLRNECERISLSKSLLNRFWLFEYHGHEIKGGMHDFRGSFSNIDLAIKAQRQSEFRWYQIFDSYNHLIVVTNDKLELEFAPNQESISIFQHYLIKN